MTLIQSKTPTWLVRRSTHAFDCNRIGKIWRKILRGPNSRDDQKTGDVLRRYPGREKIERRSNSKQINKKQTKLQHYSSTSRLLWPLLPTNQNNKAITCFRSFFPLFFFHTFFRKAMVLMGMHFLKVWKHLIQRAIQRRTHLPFMSPSKVFPDDGFGFFHVLSVQ